MPRYLIAMAIGPVQDFIAAARRTRDLWLGSHVLSEVSKAAAISLNNQNETCQNLIFPAPQNLGALNQRSFSVGNKLLAVVETNDPAKALDDAKDAANNCWTSIAEAAKQSAQDSRIVINEGIWNQQVGDVLECFGAWVSFDDTSQYKEKRRRLDQLLNARKNTREFKANPVNGNNIPKSSLDGLRENVILKSDKWANRKAGLNPNEYLDCTGIVKRLGEDPDQFTPISRVALNPWLKGLGGEVDLNEIKQCLGELVSYGVTSNVRKDTYSQLTYDGQLLYPFRLKAELTRYKNESDEESKQVVEKLEALKNAITTADLKNKNNEASPYMAVLAADGDRMGELLATMTSMDQHRDISAKLASFANDVSALVDQYEGHCIYAGGDDVLALLPLDQAVACSKALADKFKQTMSQVKNIPASLIPTLSVGLGVSHFMTPMGKQLDLARKAEKLAKSNDLPRGQSKDALAIVLQPRSGAEIDLRIRWDAQAAEVLEHCIQCHNQGLLPHGAAYDLREEALSLEWCDLTLPAHQTLITLETERILLRKRTADGEQPTGDTIRAISQRAGKIGMSNVANELILMRRFAEATRLAKQPKAQSEESSYA